ncbi:MAG: chloride channel protein [Candidatus Bathyarchaeota archaeon]|nr:chloride channel protein [Candidatus Bathyarchaeota archaeon]
MSRISEGLEYYLLVVGVGLIAASVSTSFYLLYQQLWSLTEQALTISVFLIVPLSFLAIGLPYFLVKRFAKNKNTGSGTHTVLEAYHLTNGEINLEDSLVKPTAGMLTIGLGGSAGPEGPSLLVGGGVASAIARRFKIHSDLRRRLFIAGAAAGLAATFRTPLTGILFALEIPYKNDLDRETFIEAVVASVPAYLFSIAVLGSEPIFGPVLTTEITYDAILLSLLLGIICGLYAVFFTKTFAWMGEVSFKIRKKVGNAGLICIAASFLSISGILSLYTIGVGLNFTSAIIQGTSLSLLAVVLIVLLKTFATSFTLNFGGSGGLFFPTIVIGSGIGYIFAQLFNVNYAVMFVAVGMAALVGATHKVLLTPVAFVVETLGGLFAIPALLANVVSYVVSGKHSFYPLQPRTRLKAEELALERFFLRAQKVVPEKLKKTTLKDTMTRTPVYLHHGSTVKDALIIFEDTKLRVLPVVDNLGHVIGVLNLEDIGFIDVSRHSLNLSKTILHSPVLVREQTSLEETARLMLETQQDHLFVENDDGSLIGVVSGIDVVKKIVELLSGS